MVPPDLISEIFEVIIQDNERRTMTEGINGYFNKMSDRKKAREIQYRIDHKEELAAKRKIYDERKKCQILEYQKQYRDGHQEKISQRAQEYYQNHREVIDARTRSRTRPGVFHRALLEEFKSKHCPWNEGHVAGVYQVDFD